MLSYLRNRYEVRRSTALVYLGLIDCFWWLLKNLSLLLGIVKHPKSLDLSSVKRILLVNGAHLGDLIISTATIKRIKETNPNIEIGFIAGSWGAELLQNHAGVSNFYPLNHWRLDRSSSSQLTKILRYCSQWWAISSAIRKQHYDLAILLNGYFPNFASLLWFSECQYKIGYVSAGGSPLLDLCLPKPIPDQQEKEIQLDLLAASGIHGSSEYWIEVLEKKMHSNIPNSLPKEFILLHPGTGNLHKEWPLDSWISLTKMAQKNGWKILLSGQGKRELDLCREIATQTGAINLASTLNLNEWFAVIKKASLIIGVDSAASHAAAALNKPFVGIYSGIGELKRWGPKGNKIVVLNHPMPCSPCHTRPCSERPCLLNTKPSHVMAATTQLLSQ